MRIATLAKTFRVTTETARRDLDELDNTRTGSNRSQLTFDVTKVVKVTLDHFFGIEIEEWPARIAETAMLLVDHLANQRMEEEFGLAPDRLPIVLAPTIEHGNALDVAWERVLPPSEHVIVVGNPPFIGNKRMRFNLGDG
ncbi:MAG TPA: DeoR family transcriptional regulator, partial [Ilumatobacteraceae bacterium]|nr:DeoR family transcriptional regulator [Ilumatobacteraceae bacterium]